MLSSIVGWQDRAACADSPEMDKAEFTASFPMRNEAKRLAQRYCHNCPVITNCFNWANQETYFSGVAGGAMFTSSKERAGRRSVHRVPRKGEESG
jgi:hypothetical protein